MKVTPFLLGLDIFPFEKEDFALSHAREERETDERYSLPSNVSQFTLLGLRESIAEPL